MALSALWRFCLMRIFAIFWRPLASLWFKSFIKHSRNSRNFIPWYYTYNYICGHIHHQHQHQHPVTRTFNLIFSSHALRNCCSLIASAKENTWNSATKNHSAYSIVSVGKSLHLHPSSLAGILHHYRYVRLYACDNHDFTRNLEMQTVFTYSLGIFDMASWQLFQHFCQIQQASNHIASRAPSIKAPKRHTHWIAEQWKIRWQFYIGSIPLFICSLCVCFVPL